MTLANVQNRIEKRLSGPLSAHGISLTDYLVLRQLYQAPQQKLRRIDLAQRVGLSASGVTRLLNPMQKIGLVDKEDSARDARVSLVSLSQAGARIYSEAQASFDQAAQDLLSPLGERDRAALMRMVLALS
ncbi:MarR family winged helix-turn-helix transcriptional regulator [Sinimarinibacterium sp. CAU 1509]|uniref:MarR family winged helix-turn-helix transcriptional regulator n=1 Tax=Sinimarinibacterium sp. CAU 1509 TaxID=2562283 RepID=UPI001B7F7DB2|nr:MarR family transcriptional regulator [Sinimarinibacterium sp. CAU 1509]